MKIVNIKGESLEILWTTGGISMKFSGKTWLMTAWKVTKKQFYRLSRKYINPSNTFLGSVSGFNC